MAVLDKNFSVDPQSVVLEKIVKQFHFSDEELSFLQSLPCANPRQIMVGVVLLVAGVKKEKIQENFSVVLAELPQRSILSVLEDLKEPEKTETAEIDSPSEVVEKGTLSSERESETEEQTERGKTEEKTEEKQREKTEESEEIQTDDERKSLEKEETKELVAEKEPKEREAGEKTEEFPPVFLSPQKKMLAIPTARKKRGLFRKTVMSEEEMFLELLQTQRFSDDQVKEIEAGILEGLRYEQLLRFTCAEIPAKQMKVLRLVTVKLNKEREEKENENNRNIKE